VDPEVLRSVLSSEALINRIWQGIKPTVREAAVEQGDILGAKRGLLADRASARQTLTRLNALIEQVEHRYGRGRLRSLELERQDLERALARQLEAKQHEAYRIHAELTGVEAARGRLPKDQLDLLTRELNKLGEKRAELVRLRDQWAEARDSVQHFPWVNEAVAAWERMGAEPAPARSGRVGLGLALLGIGLLLGIASVILPLEPAGSRLLEVAGLGAVAGGLFAVWGSLRGGQARATSVRAAEEQARIEAEFEHRFGQRAGGLPGLRAAEADLRDRHARYLHLSETIEQREGEVAQLEASVARLLSQLSTDPVEPSAWLRTAEGLRQNEESLSRRSHALELRLAELGVDPSDYRSQPGEAGYSEQRARELAGRQAELAAELRAAQQDLDNLKQEVARETGDEISAGWEQLLEHLLSVQQGAEAGYRIVTARILGQIAVAQVLEQLRAEEDEKLRAGLAAPEVTGLLREITGRYFSLDYRNGGLIVGGDTANHDLIELSTGTREQVLLSLRLGLASRLAGGRPLFVLLDDAFQHSDWPRRERMVGHVVRLAQTGWQVTYLTMDDHLANLFDAAARAGLDGEYRRFQLPD
jgi:uncharacterized protein YhaN